MVVVNTWTRISKHNRTHSGATVEERLFLYDKPVLASELVESKHPVSINSAQARAMFDGDRAMMGDRFESLVGRKGDWREMSYVLPGRELMQGSDVILDPKGVEYAAVTSWHLTALRNGLKPVVTPTAVLGVTLTSDNILVYGERGGRDDPGMLCVSPAGVSNGTLLESYLTELREELGVLVSGGSEPQLIGYSTDHRNTKGILAVWYSKVDETFDDLKNMHEEALQGREAVWDTRAALIAEGHTNFDAWEFRQLVGLPNEPGYLDKLLASEQYSFGGVNLPLRDAGAMALDIYNHALKEGKLN
ncbi:hypothetical protein HOA92_05145 [archaeon]|nr:hypothetical protein [archaeon]MBT6762403.1 hypothetical protein [archaeon]